MKRSDLLKEKIRKMNFIIFLSSDMIHECMEELESITSGDNEECEDYDDYEVDNVSNNELANQCLLYLRKHLWHEPIKILKPICADDYLSLYKDGWNVEEWVEELKYQWGQSKSTIYNNFKKFGIKPKEVLKPGERPDWSATRKFGENIKKENFNIF